MFSPPDFPHEKKEAFSASREIFLIKFSDRGNLNIDGKRITAFGQAVSPEKMQTV